MNALMPWLYPLIKGMAYMAWCGFGARLHDHKDRLWLKGFVYGLIRFAMGIFLGLFLIVWLVNLLSKGINNGFSLYLGVYVPVRWLEWSLMATLMDVGHRSLKNCCIGLTDASRLWRLGGIVISCLADVPMMVAIEGLPIGRFFC